MIAIAAFGFAPEPVAQEIHPERAAQIAAINTANTTWTAAAHPRFVTQPPGASKSLLGALGNWGVEVREAIKRGEVERYMPSNDFAVPDEWDAATAFPKCAKTIGDIRDQSNCGCCWAFAGAEAASDRMCIASDASLLMPLSAQDVCFNANFNGCGGGQITTPWNYIKRSGVVTGGQNKGIGPFGKGYCAAFSLPHCHHHGPQGDDPYPSEGAAGCPSESSPRGPTKCDTDAEAPHNSFKADKYSFSGRVQSASGAKAIKQFMMEGGTCEVAFTVYSDFENYAEGIYKHTAGSFAGGHAVKFVGWGVENGQEYWKVANSWNPYWGEKGYFRIAPGEGGIDDECVGSAASAKWSKMSELA